MLEELLEGLADPVVMVDARREILAANSALRTIFPGQLVGRHRVSRDGRSVHLSPTEFRLLCVLLERPGHVYSRDTLLNRVHGRDADVEPRTIDVHIGRLRKSLNAGGETDIIRTVRGGGYSIDCRPG